jgi:hypothetical protein
MFETIMRCVLGTAFGVPVEPDVNNNFATVILRVEHGHGDRHVLNALFTLARGHQDFLWCDGGFRRKRRHCQRCGERRERDACE